MSNTPSRNVTRFDRQSLKPVVIRLSNKLSATYWPGRRRSISSILLALLAGFVPGLAGAAPTGAQVVAGSALVTRPAANSTLITQTSNHAILNWQSFSIGAQESVRFAQPSASSVALNRVIGGDPSRIFGSLSSNGQVFLVNGAGIYFAPGASADVGGLVASTLEIADGDFMAGKYAFAAGANAGKVENLGALKGAYVVLAGPQVSNAGSISTPGGSAALAAGGRMQMQMAGSQLISLSVDAAAANAAIDNTGSIHAGGGKVILSARSANAVLDTVINTQGIVRAQSIGSRNGEIYIDGGEAGAVLVAGEVSAAGAQAGTGGGRVQVLGSHVALLDGARIDVSGDAGGGSALIGGGFHGAGTARNATVTVVQQGAQINADALAGGDGGRVAVWADGHTTFAGSVSARGGSQSGNGGFVETSGKQSLSYRGTVNTSAANGASGTLLLDPNTIFITDTDATTLPNDGKGLFQDASAGVSWLKTADLLAALASSNVTVDTTSGNAGEGSILLFAGLNYNSPNTLTLNATKDITIAADSITKSAGVTNSGTGGLHLQAGGSVSVLESVSLGGGNFTVRGFGGSGGSGGLFTSGGKNISTTGDVDIASKSSVAVGSISANKLNIAAGGALTQSAGSSLLVTGATSLQTTAAGNIALSNSGNNFGGAVTLAAGKDASLRDADKLTVQGAVGGALSVRSGGSTTFGETTVAGALNQVSLGAVTQTGTLTVAGVANFNSSTVSDISLTDGGNNFGTVNLSSSRNAAIMDADDLTLLGTTTGELKVGTGGALTLGNTTVGTTMSVDSMGGIAQSAGAVVSVVGAATLAANAASVKLDNGGNHFGSVNVVSARNVALKDRGNTTVKAVTSGDLALTTAGTATLGQSAIGGALALSAGGQVTQAAGAVLSVEGATVVNAAGANVTLDNSENNFKGAVTIGAANAVKLADRDMLTLSGATTGDLAASAGAALVVPAGVTNVGGNLALAGTEIQAGAATLSVAGASTLEATAGDVVLGNASLHGLTVSAAGAATFAAGATAVDGNLTMKAASIVQEAGNVLTASGTSMLTAAGAISLGNAGNDLGGRVYLTTSADAVLADKSALQLAANLGGSLKATAGDALTLIAGATSVGKDLTLAGSSIGQETGSTLYAAGASSLSSTAGSIDLTNGANDFAGQLTVSSARDVTLLDKNQLTLQAATAGNLTVAATGALTLAGATTVNAGAALRGASISQAPGGKVSVGGNTQLTSVSGAITLANGGNDFQGGVALNSAQNASLADVNTVGVSGLVMGNLAVEAATQTSYGVIDVRGNLAQSGAGAVVQAAGGAMSVKGTSTFSSGAVKVDRAGNDFAGTVILANSGDAAIADANTVTLTGKSGGALTVTAGKDIITTGVTSAGGSMTLNSTEAANLASVSAGGNLSVSAGKAAQVGSATTSAAGSTLSLASQGTLKVDAASAAGSMVVNSKDAATLNTVKVAGNLTLTARGATLGATSVDGNLKLSGEGDLRQTGSLAVKGATSLDAGAGGVIVLDNASNNFGGEVTLASKQSVSLADTDTLTVMGSARELTTKAAGGTAFGMLKVEGALSQSGGGEVKQLAGSRLDVGGASSFATTGDVTLEAKDNAFRESVAANAKKVSIVNALGIKLGALTASEKASVSTPFNITQADGAVVKAPALLLSSGDGIQGVATSIGSLDKPLRIEGNASVQLLKAANAYFQTVPPGSLLINNGPFESYVYGADLRALYVNQTKESGKAGQITASTLSPLAAALRAAEKKADSFRELVELGLPWDLQEKVVYPHSGLMQLTGPDDKEAEKP